MTDWGGGTEAMMMYFSEYLKELISERNINISTLAKKCGLERTMLSRVVSGQRTLPYQALDGMIYQLKLTPGEEKRLRSYYEQQFEKEGIRIARKLIEEMFADLAGMNFKLPAFGAGAALPKPGQYADGQTVFHGKNNVRFLLRMVFAEEASHPEAACSLTIPMTGSRLWDSLDLPVLLGKNDGTLMKADHILCLDNAKIPEEINTGNLECFCRIFPICLVSRQNYHPYYYYGNLAESNYLNPYPYFAVTHSCVVCISEDGGSAMLLRKPEQIAQYTEFFQRLRNHCYSLVQYISNPLAIMDAYQKYMAEDSLYTIMDQPCFARYYTGEFVQKYLRREIPGYEEVCCAAMEHFSRLQNTAHFCTVFTESGLKRFMDSGTLDDYPTAVAAPFEMSDRVYLMKSLASDIRSGKIKGRVMQERFFPDYLSLCASAEGGAGFFTTQNFPQEGGICSVSIQEPGLGRAFYGWLRGLPDSRQTLTAEETADLVEKIAASGHGNYQMVQKNTD